jgi:hypothetical protein
MEMAPSHGTASAALVDPAFKLRDGTVFFNPHPRQFEIWLAIAKRVVFGEGPRRFFLRGNRGGGKSILMRRGVCHQLAMALPGLKYIIVRRNLPDLRLNHLIYLGAEMRQLDGEYHETHGIAKYPNGSLGFYKHCEEEADVEKIVGAEGAILFMDEAPQIKWDFQRTIAPSLRVPKGPDGRQPFYTCEVYGGNPIGESIEELDKYFIDQDVSWEEDPDYAPEDWRCLPIGLDDNPSLEKDDYLKQFSGLPAHYRAAWVDGVRMDSRTLFSVQKTKDGRPYHYISELPKIGDTPLLRVPWISVYRGYDHGFFPDPAVCVWFVVFGRRIIAVHEETWFQTTAKDIAAKVIETTTELVGETACAMTCVDPTIDVKDGTVTVMDTLEMHGVPCDASINDRVLYADAIHSLLGEEVEPGVPRFQVYEPGCPMLAKYLPKMRWDEKNPRKMADHKFDHWIVALAYFAISSGVLTNAQAGESATRPIWMDWLEEDAQPRRRRM